MRARLLFLTSGRGVPRTVFALCLMLAGLAFSGASPAGVVDYCNDEAPCLKYGAATFQERCILCHGSDGLGEGTLSLLVKDYPSTNLTEPRVSKDSATLRRVIIEGTRPLMPPWGDELTVTQIESLVLFVGMLRTDLEGALKLSRVAAASANPSLKIGRATFIGRCTLCHGTEAMGDGRMAARLTPKPANLTKSRAPDSYLKMIISKGGAAVGRSASMPAWESDLTPPEIESVIMYINTLRPAAGSTAAPAAPGEKP
jgi:mono/diheme cytochrome c family protein